jgi:hypothetical protein
MNRVLSCLFLLALISIACGKAPSLQQRLQQMVEVHNQHNVTQELAFYADDATFVIPGENPIVGKAALRDLFESDAATNSVLVFKDMVTTRDTVIVNSIKERNDFLRYLGVPELHYAPGTKIVFNKGLIQKTELAPSSEEDEKIFERQWQDVMGWLGAAHPELVKEAQSGWLARHGRKAAHAWMELLAEWQVSKSGPK